MDKKITISKLAEIEALNEVFTECGEYEFDEVIKIVEKDEQYPNDLIVCDLYDNLCSSDIVDNLNMIKSHNLRLFRAIAQGDYIID